MKLRKILPLSAVLVCGTLALSPSARAALGGIVPNLQIGSDVNSAGNSFVQPQDPALAGGGKDQSMQSGDVLFGTGGTDLQIGKLGTDILIGGAGGDVQLGGPEHFNPSNRDRAFGGPGSDVFLWSPGDGSDLYDGGPGIDTVVFGKLGEVVDGAVVFEVFKDQLAGETFVDPVTGLPILDVTNSPGFCQVIDKSSTTNTTELDSLELDHLVRFFLRSFSQSFAAGEQADDNGLRVTLHLKSVERLVCTTEAGGEIVVLDLTTSPPTALSVSQLPRAVQVMIK